MWRKKRHTEEEPKACPAATPAPRKAEHDITADCAAFLDGRYAEWLLDRGRPVPPWVWLNQAAHASHLDLLVAMTQITPIGPPGWAGARHAIALELLRVVDDIEQLEWTRREVLVPLELDLARATLDPPLTPGQLVALVRSTLATDCSHPRPRADS